MEVDATVGQMHVKMQKELAEMRSRYRTKLHKERQKINELRRSIK